LTVSFACDIWVRGCEKASYVEIVKRSSMAEGGRWIWQANKPRAPGRGRNLGAKGAGAQPLPRLPFRPQVPPPNFRSLLPTTEYRAPQIPYGDQ
jgi:hypothetical protein